MAITFTVDLEDPTELYDPNGRYSDMTRRVLDLCDEYHRKATFFVVGRVARANKKLVQEIATRGHEVAYHSYGHVSLTDDNKKHFAHQLKIDKQLFEGITGNALIGFRAPRFSLTPKSVWAIDALGNEGFLYSSSIMPTDVSLFGFPGAPRNSFLWQNGLIEFPLPLANVFGRGLPYLGGIYLYLTPAWLIRHFISNDRSGCSLWTYTHPYDFDRSTAWNDMPNTPRWVSLVLGIGRFFSEPKIRQLLEKTEGPLLRDLALREGKRVFEAGI